MKHLIIKDIINSELAVSTENGEKVFKMIDSCLQKKEKIELDFAGITIMITAFLNAAIGKLYGKKEYTPDFLNEYLKLKNVELEDRSLFIDVIQRAKEYFANKEDFEKNSNNAIYGDD
ncbi:STAS-like domain-containing protein [Flavobacterium hibisci]|uniref:STAS-like domain-containing protein n=1 Tax=Flavobacterium hibisci TaxID=1914462 RepID=UPI001CBBAF10|nr:STAS-like domain-containing protein [Flavobacterium hibisci]MBZ4044254.1 STAS-like domain-containing protein [Flavobacterium hibisci]